MKLKFMIFILAFTCCIAQEATISLLNDSPYFLRVTVQSADGTYLGGEALNAGEFKKWTTTFKPDRLDIPGTPISSLTPFTVIWRCEHGGFYSVCNQASPGALIRANICPGAHYCAPKKEEAPPPECKCIMPECPKCPTDQKEKS